MQTFHINQFSTLPTLRVELVHDGTHDFLRSYQFNNEIQNADVTFTMWDSDDHLKISKAPCSIVLSKDYVSCTDKFIIEYKWKERDTKLKGVYKGRFTINYLGDLYEKDMEYHEGTLIMPIIEDLEIIVK